MTRETYNLNKMEKGQVNRAYEYDARTDQQITPHTNGQLTSTVVEGPSREEFDKPIEFLLSCIAMSVGLGNIWRFPFTAFENGGGAFLIPYLVVLFFIGKPMYFLEMSMGQFSSRGQVKVWKCSPFFKGVGFGSAFGTGCVCTYYCSLMAVTVFYFVQSFQTDLPWSKCNPSWNDSHGIECWPNNTIKSGSNKSIPELYFKLDVLLEKENINDGIGLPEWRLTICLAVSWAVILFSLIKGVKSAGKVAYFTALFPYVVLIILLIRGLTLPGAFNGVWYFFKPDWTKLWDYKVWSAACTQCFFSLSTGFGPIIMFSSYNPITHNVYRDAMIISIMDTLTSLLAGVTIFGILGNLAFELDKDVKDVTGGGPSLAFISYPEAISKFTFVPQFFAVLFFLMLFTLGVGSATSLTNAIITVIHDQFVSVKKIWITTAVCISGFLLGLIYVTPGGQWMLDLVDTFGAGFVIFLMALLEMVGFIWVYGLSNVVRDIELMLNIKVSMYWKFCWGFFIPVALFLLFVSSTFNRALNPLQYNKMDYPIPALIFGWIIAAIAVLIIPIAALHSIWTRKSDGLFEKLKESFRPSADWGPKDKNVREAWLCTPSSPTFASEAKEIMRKISKRLNKS